MPAINTLHNLIQAVAQGNRRYKIVVAWPHDAHTCEAIEAAIRQGLADFILVGNAAELARLPWLAELSGHVQIMQADDADDAARKAVATIRQGKADVLMKGKLNTDNLLRAVLNKECGILPAGNVLSHVTISEIPGYSRLLAYGDVAVIPYPTLAQREAIIGYLCDTIRALGVDTPRVALLHFTEKVNPKFPVSTDYRTLCEMAAQGRWGNAIVDGPMDLRTAVDPEAGAIKGIISPIEGRADALMMADIEAGNVFYKTLTTFAGATNAGIICGAMAPIVLPSRGDSAQGKLASLALACKMCRQ